MRDFTAFISLLILPISSTTKARHGARVGSSALVSRNPNSGIKSFSSRLVKNSSVVLAPAKPSAIVWRLTR